MALHLRLRSHLALEEEQGGQGNVERYSGARRRGLLLLLQQQQQQHHWSSSSSSSSSRRVWHPNELKS